LEASARRWIIAGVSGGFAKAWAAVTMRAK
jgi:hypothetical protein